MILLRQSVSLFLVLVILFTVAAVLEASDSSTVNFTTNQSITAFSTCKKVTNGSGTGLNVYVPTQSDAEWQSFYTNPPSGVTIGSCGPAATTTIFLTSGSSWTVPADWNPSNNSIHVIGGGASGGGRYGGGGGAYSRINNISLTAGASITYAVGGTSGTTYFNGTSCGTASVCAVGGSGTSGGSASSGVGAVRYSGGSGGTYSASLGGGGGGGAGGPSGNGGAGGNSQSSGIAFYGGGGGGGANGGSNGSPNPAGPNGGAGGSPGGGNGGNAQQHGGSGSYPIIWTQTSNGATAGPSGGGGGGGSSRDTRIGTGGGASYGGGGGGGGTNGGGGATGGPGGQGIIVITYGP